MVRIQGSLKAHFILLFALALLCWSDTTIIQQSRAGEGEGEFLASHSSPQIGFSPQRNSTKKIRVRPSQQSLRAGSAIQWLGSYQDALAQSKETGKPIFWYIPSVSGTFMDRKTEVNRYMLAGPFSWPAIIDLINQSYIPLKLVPGKGETAQFGIEVYQFIEPGFLVVQPDQTISLTADRLTTTNPIWLYHHLAKTVSADKDWLQASDPNGTKELNLWLELLGSEKARTVPDDVLATLQRSEHVELRLISGMLLHNQGKQQAAIDTWAMIAKDFPEHPLAWKAACEAQRIGPFGRGFEVFGDQLKIDPAPPTAQRLTSAATDGQFNDEALWRHGIEFLLRMQDQSGGFFDSDYDFGGTDSLPNVYVAVTSLAGLALIEATEVESLGDLREQLSSAIGRALEYVSDPRHLNFDDTDEILWAQSYRIRFLAKAHTLNYPQATLERLQTATDQLLSLQSSNGSWFHEYPNAFVTGTALVALLDAKDRGANVDQARIDKGLDRLASQRHTNGAYPYDVRRPGRNDAGTGEDLAASGGRLSICELARCGWRQIRPEDLSTAVGLSLTHHHLLEKALKYDNHTNTYAYGGFFFWYDMQARTEAINMLPAGANKDDFRRQQQDIIRRLPEIDGCFVDSHELGRCYGTAMALLSLGIPET